MSSPTVGVLALQGAFAKHQETLQALGVESILVRKPSELIHCDALIIPGGESSTMNKQMHFIGLIDPIKEFAEKKPVFGTCAGLILMAKEVLNDSINPFSMIDMSVERNAFGRQYESFHAEIQSEIGDFHAVFIRAPRIKALGKDVQVIAEFKGEPVLVQQGHHLAASFHPELTSNGAIHQYFLKLFGYT